MSVGTALIYLAALLVASFVISGVVPRYLSVRRRLPRVEEFERQYRAYSGARDQDYENTSYHYGPPAHDEKSSELRSWLVARRNEMQRDAQEVGKGIVYVAPPPMIGGPFRPHSYFSDLFDEQSFTDHGPQYRLDELATIIHDTRNQARRWKRDVFNPWAWVRLAFERIVRFPYYVLRRSGFSDKAVASTGARIVTAVWSVLVGAATIAGFVVTLLHGSG
jgi:hypothetical protein